MQDTFTNIYKNNFWKIKEDVKSKSGPGSDDCQTFKIVNENTIIITTIKYKIYI